MKLIRRHHDQRRSLTDPMTFREVMQRFFDQPLWDIFGSREDNFMQTFSQMGMQFIPKADVIETDKEITIKVDVQGCKPENIEAELTDDSLIIKGKTEEEKEEKDARFYRRERSYGEFYREIPLPANVDSEKVTCEVRNGTMVVTLPKIEQKEKRKLKIQLK